MSVPFEALGVPAPRRDEIWLGNFGRERYAQLPPSTPHGQPKLYLWSQGAGTGFHDPCAFGSIRFR